MQIIVRRDLLAARLGRDFHPPLFTTVALQYDWGVGSLMTQVAHATSAVSSNDSVHLTQT